MKVIQAIPRSQPLLSYKNMRSDSNRTSLQKEPEKAFPVTLLISNILVWRRLFLVPA